MLTISFCNISSICLHASLLFVDDPDLVISIATIQILERCKETTDELVVSSTTKSIADRETILKVNDVITSCEFWVRELQLRTGIVLISIEYRRYPAEASLDHVVSKSSCDYLRGTTFSAEELVIAITEINSRSHHVRCHCIDIATSKDYVISSSSVDRSRCEVVTCIDLLITVSSIDCNVVSSIEAFVSVTAWTSVEDNCLHI